MTRLLLANPQVSKWTEVPRSLKASPTSQAREALCLIPTSQSNVFDESPTETVFLCAYRLKLGCPGVCEFGAAVVFGGAFPPALPLTAPAMCCTSPLIQVAVRCYGNYFAEPFDRQGIIIFSHSEVDEQQVRAISDRVTNPV